MPCSINQCSIRCFEYNIIPHSYTVSAEILLVRIHELSEESWKCWCNSGSSYVPSVPCSLFPLPANSEECHIQLTRDKKTQYTVHEKILVWENFPHAVLAFVGPVLTVKCTGMTSKHQNPTRALTDIDFKSKLFLTPEYQYPKLSKLF